MTRLEACLYAALGLAVLAVYFCAMRAALPAGAS